MFGYWFLSWLSLLDFAVLCILNVLSNEWDHLEWSKLYGGLLVSPCMIKGNDIWISVFVLVVRLLTLLGSELIQARGSSEEKKYSQKLFSSEIFSLGGLERGVLCHCAWGGGQWLREEVNFKPTVIWAWFSVIVIWWKLTFWFYLPR